VEWLELHVLLVSIDSCGAGNIGLGELSLLEVSDRWLLGEPPLGHGSLYGADLVEL